MFLSFCFLWILFAVLTPTSYGENSDYSFETFLKMVQLSLKMLFKRMYSAVVGYSVIDVIQGTLINCVFRIPTGFLFGLLISEREILKFSSILVDLSISHFLFHVFSYSLLRCIYFYHYLLPLTALVILHILKSNLDIIISFFFEQCLHDLILTCLLFNFNMSYFISFGFHIESI